MSADEVARSLANPNTPLATLTVKNQIRTFEGDLQGADDQDSFSMLFQPSFPFPVGDDGDVILRRPAIPALFSQPVPNGINGGFDQRTELGDIAMDLGYGSTSKSGFLFAAGDPQSTEPRQVPQQEPTNDVDGPEQPTGVVQGDREELYRNLSSSDFVKSVPFSGSDLRLSVGGYVKTDFIADFSGTGDRSQFLISTIPVAGTSGPQSGEYVNIHAKESRLSFDLRHQSDDLPFNQAFIEFDFYGQDASYGSPRLRHAYLRWGNLLAGRTWSILSDLRGLPYMIDFAFGDALYGGRTGQVRWEEKLSDRFKLTTGLELLDDEGIENVDDLPGIARADLPAFALRGDYEWDGGSVSLGATVGQLRWDGGGAVNDAKAPFWATVLAARVFLDEEHRHYACTQLAYGDGAGGSVAALGGQAAGAILTADGRLETMPLLVTSVGLHYAWSDEFSSNLAMAWTEIDATPFRQAESIQAGGAGHVNLVWKLAESFQVGAELMAGRRVNTDGKSGDAQRVQFMAMYTF